MFRFETLPADSPSCLKKAIATSGRPDFGGLTGVQESQDGVPLSHPLTGWDYKPTLSVTPGMLFSFTNVFFHGGSFHILPCKAVWSVVPWSSRITWSSGRFRQQDGLIRSGHSWFLSAAGSCSAILVFGSSASAIHAWYARIALAIASPRWSCAVAKSSTARSLWGLVRAGRRHVAQGVGF